MSGLRARLETLRQPFRWISATALFALAPKCLVCLAAYSGIGSLLGARFASAEIYGAPTAPAHAITATFTLLGAALALILFFGRRPTRGGNCALKPDAKVGGIEKPFCAALPSTSPSCAGRARRPRRAIAVYAIEDHAVLERSLRDGASPDNLDVHM